MFSIFPFFSCVFFLRIFITDSIDNYRSETCSDGSTLVWVVCNNCWYPKRKPSASNYSSEMRFIYWSDAIFERKQLFIDYVALVRAHITTCVHRLPSRFHLIRLFTFNELYTLHTAVVSCTGTHTLARSRTHLRLLTMFVLGQVNSWMKLSRNAKTHSVERQQQNQRNETQRRIRRCLNVSRFIQSRVHFSVDVRRFYEHCAIVYGLVNTLCGDLCVHWKCNCFQLNKILRKSSGYLEILVTTCFCHSNMKRFLICLICGWESWGVKLEIQSENWLKSGDNVVWTAHLIAPRLSKINN